jgi:hypothetical protein
MSFSRTRDKETVIHPYNRYYSVTGKNELSSHGKKQRRTLNKCF